MEVNESFYLSKLKQEFSRRQRVNSSYSLRAFAKDLEIDSSNMSAILKKKRGLPSHRAERMADLLKLSPKEAAFFIMSTYRKKMSLDKINIPSSHEAKKILLDDTYYQIIAEWEHYAVLQLMKTFDFESCPDWIARRLNISINRSEVVINNLIQLGFIGKNENGFYRKVANLETSEDVESKALQTSHIDTIEIAKEKIETVDVKLRDFSSMTMAIDPDKIPEAKAIIREFQDKLYALMTTDKASEVYIYNCQLFPVSNRENT